jgi:hypothetical protein
MCTLLTRSQHACLVLIAIDGRQGFDVVPGRHCHSVVQGYGHIRSVRENELDMGQMSSKLFFQKLKGSSVRYWFEYTFLNQLTYKFCFVCSYLFTDGGPMVPCK